MYDTVHSQIYFILIYKRTSYDGTDKSEVMKSIDNLISKGDQKELQTFKDENKLIYLDEEYLTNYNQHSNEFIEGEDTIQKNFFFRFKYYEDLPKTQNNINISEEEYQMMDYLKLNILLNKDNKLNMYKNKLKCSIL